MLLLLLVNPSVGRFGSPPAEPPIVLLDASLSMAGRPGTWRAALDSARSVGRGGVIWRFGDRVTAFDTSPPADGASHIAPALAAAATRGGAVVIVTDGAVDDLADVPPDLRRRARVIALPRPPFRDAFIASITAPERVGAGDTLQLMVGYGTAGPRAGRAGGERGQLVVESANRRLAAVPVVLPDSGVVTTTIALPAARLAPPGYHVLTIRLDDVPDVEPRDDARQLVIEVSAQPSAVVLAAPPDWDSRFLARVLEDVARVPVRLYDETEPGHWREGRSLLPAAPANIARDLQAARLVALLGDPHRTGAMHRHPGTATLVWNTTTPLTGEWYVTPPPPSPLQGDLAAIPWDSLPPVAALAGSQGESGDSGRTVVLSAQLSRRGPTAPIVVLEEGRQGRRVTVGAVGLYRWAFRGGMPEQAYRALIAAVANWLLAPAAGNSEPVVPVRREVENGLPLTWRWSAVGGPPRTGLTVTLTDDRGGVRRDTLRFDAGGRALEWLAPGTYRYDVAGGLGRGVVVVEVYSDEWRPAPAAFASQPGGGAERANRTGWRERWWVFVVALAAFAGEWAWRRRQGLP